MVCWHSPHFHVVRLSPGTSVQYPMHLTQKGSLFEAINGVSLVGFTVMQYLRQSWQRRLELWGLLIEIFFLGNADRRPEHSNGDLAIKRV